MDNETIVRTENAKNHWSEATRWNGNNHISKATGSQWEHEALYLSNKGRYYVVHTSQWQGSTPSAKWMSNLDAARWLLMNDHELPIDLVEFESEASE
jgi:hypothetical protein